ncbi:MAG TPA: hypothetical protein VJ891_05650 [Casimicrobiaceae bacterium]|nr:hypothetical protein [Casimicrobiaceae bacterium]
MTRGGCERATTMDAPLHDFIGIVVREAVGDRDHRAHEAHLFDVHAKRRRRAKRTRRRRRAVDAAWRVASAPPRTATEACPMRQ